MFNKNAYDAGSLDISTTPVEVKLDISVRQLLIYPTDDCFVSLNDSPKEIFLPKNMWTPLCVSSNFLCDKFTIRTETTCTVHWQGWVN